MNPSLRTQYLGLELKNPIVASSGPLTSRMETLMKLEEAGAAAVVLPSLFEEEIVREQVEITLLYDFVNEGFAEAQSYLPEMEDYRTGPDDYLRLVRQAKQSLTIPVIGSINGVSNGGWIRYGKMIEEAGADALELNIYFLATDPEVTALDVEQRYLELVAAVRASVSIPLAVKIGPYFSSLANMTKRLFEAGADGLVLFNRFLQPDIDVSSLTVEPHLVLSTRDELRLPLRWIAILRSYFEQSLAATSGVHAPEDVIKLLLAGANIAMTTSGVLRRGPSLISELLLGLRSWMEEKEYVSVSQLQGSLSQRNCPDPAAFERANYVKTIRSFTSNLIW
jgi:dihydroorotate dehydrogenase (fumarate)